MGRKIIFAFSVFALLYLGVGFAFHIKWKSDLDACRQARAHGNATWQEEFVEPEVFGGLLGLAFDMTNWPVYAWANLYHDGTPFATPCTR